MTLNNMTGITEGSYTGFCKSQLITCNFAKACNGVCPFEDALQHADKRQTMNEQHIINHDKDWIIGCIEHDGFIKTHRFDKANQIILDALQFADRPTRVYEYLRERIGDIVDSEAEFDAWFERMVWHVEECNRLADRPTGWIPVSERLPGKDGCYLVSTTGTNNDVIDIAYYIEGLWHKASRIKAWMPLPEPYREGGEV